MLSVDPWASQNVAAAIISQFRGKHLHAVANAVRSSNLEGRTLHDVALKGGSTVLEFFKQQLNLTIAPFTARKFVAFILQTAHTHGVPADNEDDTTSEAQNPTMPSPLISAPTISIPRLPKRASPFVSALKTRNTQPPPPPQRQQPRIGGGSKANIKTHAPAAGPAPTPAPAPAPAVAPAPAPAVKIEAKAASAPEPAPTHTPETEPKSTLEPEPASALTLAPSQTHSLPLLMENGLFDGATQRRVRRWLNDNWALAGVREKKLKTKVSRGFGTLAFKALQKMLNHHSAPSEQVAISGEDNVATIILLRKFLNARLEGKSQNKLSLKKRNIPTINQGLAADTQAIRALQQYLNRIYAE